jgi:hypothetical protein
MPRRDDEDDFDGDDDLEDRPKRKAKGGSPAAARLSGPAIGLIVCGALSAVGYCINIPFNIYQMTQPRIIIPAGQPGAEFAALSANPGGSVAFGVVAVLVSAFVIFGGIQMKNAKMYGVSMAAAIVSVIPCCSPCLCLGIPFGIWALIVLMDADVKSAFTS